MAMLNDFHTRLAVGELPELHLIGALSQSLSDGVRQGGVGRAREDASATHLDSGAMEIGE